MDLFSLLILSCAVAMDAFAVSLCKGLSVLKLKIKDCVIIGLYFGGFQALMPVIGYFIGAALHSYITKIDHWIAFVLLTLLGLKMIKESRQEQTCSLNSDQFGFKIMFPLAIATSIDALAVGISFAFLNVNLLNSVIIIGLITFVFAILGMKIGNSVGIIFKSKAELIGGLALICIGLKILLEHLFTT